MAALAGARFLMSEVPLCSQSTHTGVGTRVAYRGTSLIRNTHPPRITVGP